MLLFLLILSIGIALLLTNDNNKRKGILGGIIALLYFPLGVILALTKKYK